MYTPTVIPPDPIPVPDSFMDSGHAEPEPEPFALNSTQTTSQETNAPHPTLVAAARVLPLVIGALGIGASRFLKGIIPVVTGWLALPISTSTSPSSAERDAMASSTSSDKPVQTGRSGPLALHFAALHIIDVLSDVCAPRMAQWAVTIVDGMARCWVGCMDVVGVELEPPSIEALQARLRETAVKLSSICPSVVKVCRLPTEYPSFAIQCCFAE